MKTSLNTILIAVLAALLVWFGSALIRVENERYALFTGLCTFDAKSMEPLDKCTRNAQTRTSPLWHLYYALFP